MIEYLRKNEYNIGIRLNAEEDSIMGDTINVVFLGEKYSFPGELAQYVIYCNEFEKISDRLMNKLLATIAGIASYVELHDSLVWKKMSGF